MVKLGKMVAVLAASLALVLSMSSLAFAADTHSYKAYQIFEGTQATGKSELVVTGWGAGIDGDKFLTALKADADGAFGGIFKSCTTPKQVAEAIGAATTGTAWADGSDEANAFAKLADQYKKGDGITLPATLNAGYYLVVDTTATAGLDDVKNLSLLQLTNKGEFAPTQKTDKPNLIKKVMDINDSTGTVTAWQDSADYDIGDSVPFELTTQLPTKLNMDAYNAYKLVFSDTLCPGLTFDGETSVKVYIDKAGQTASTTPLTSGYVVAADAATNSFTVTIADAAAAGAEDGDKIRVDFSATLNSKANLGSLGNPNTAYLEYSNNPNWDENEINPITGLKTGYWSTQLGKTPVDKVIVFTYKLVINKIKADVAKTALPGAGFTLYKYDNATSKYVAVGAEVKGDGMTTFVWEGVDDGQYKLVETTVPAGYNQMADQEFTISATHSETSDNPELLTFTGEKLSGTASTIEFDADKSAGTLTTNIVNRSGSTLPETGDIGTAIFYIGGSVLILGAIALFIKRFRLRKPTEE